MADEGRKNEKALAQIEERRKMYQDCFSGQAGEYVLEDLKTSFFVGYTTFSKDGLEIAYREGIRTAYLHIARMLQDKPKEAR